MKMIEPESILDVLENENNEIILSKEIIEKTYLPVKKMTDILDDVQNNLDH